MRSPLRWVGSKRWHVALVRNCWDGVPRIVELFAGSAAVTFGLDPERALLNDANPHLINFYRQLQQGLEFTIPMVADEKRYYENRDWFNALIRDGNAATGEGAQLFYYLNRFGFNSMCRFNSKGEFNVPFRPRHREDGGLRPNEIRTADQPLDEYRKAVANWEFRHGDYAGVELDPDDFVYADQPYDGTFNGYTEEGWTFEDAESVAVLLRDHPGRVMLMNAATEPILKLYRDLGYHVNVLTGSQRMHASRSRTDDVLEVMATNFAIDLAPKVSDDVR